MATLDRDPWLLNVGNGTLNLKTGKLQPHSRGDLITRLIPIDYDEGAACPLWMSFLERVTGSDVGANGVFDKRPLAIR